MLVKKEETDATRLYPYIKYDMSVSMSLVVYVIFLNSLSNSSITKLALFSAIIYICLNL